MSIGWQALVRNHHGVLTIDGPEFGIPHVSIHSITCESTANLFDGKEIAFLQIEVRSAMSALHSSFVPCKIRSLVFLLALCTTSPSLTRAKELSKSTAQAFEQYVLQTEVRMQRELADANNFLYFDSLPGSQRDSMLARLHNGQVVIEQMSTYANGKKIQVPDGLVHHWLAIGFIPRATRDQAVELAQDYSRHTELYAPDVQRAHVLARDDRHFLVYYRLYHHAIVSAVYDAEFNVDYMLPDAVRGYCFARAVSIAEVQNPDQPGEKKLPVGNDHGYMWRLNLYTRYLQSDSGLYVQIEFVALSRSVPGIIAWLVNPYIRSVPLEYLTNYVHATQKALSAHHQQLAGETLNNSSEARGRTEKVNVFSITRSLPCLEERCVLQ